MTEFQNNPNTVDAIIEKDGKILLIRRDNEPFEGQLALPGGFVDYGEKVEEALVREVKEEVDVEVSIKAILGVYSGKYRDPRGPIISTVFICDFEGTPSAGSDAVDFEWIDLTDLYTVELAFDHTQILSHYLEWKKSKRTYWSSLPP